MLVTEVREGIEFIEHSSDRFGFGEVATTSDGHDAAFLAGVNRVLVRALPGAVVDFVGGGEAVVVFGVGFGDFDAGHLFGAVSVFDERVCSSLVSRAVNFDASSPQAELANLLVQITSLDLVSDLA